MTRAGHPSGLPEDSVLAGLRPFGWDTRESVRYEVALEMLGQLVAACTDRMTREQAKVSPDRAVVEECDRLQGRYLEQQRRLRSADHDAVAEVLANVRELQQRVLHDL
jgi:hypothetical protein